MFEDRCDRRDFLARTALTASALAIGGRLAGAQAKEPLFKISLAQWSFYRQFKGQRGVDKYDPLDFAKIAKEGYGIDAIEYVNQFYMNHGTDENYIKEMKKRADDQGVRSVLIMVDSEGDLGASTEEQRNKVVENHKKWAQAAKILDCHSIRVNARTSPSFSYEEQMNQAADGLRKLVEYGASLDLNVIVENHGQLSSNGAWLAGVMKKVDHPRCGTLPDFGNFDISRTEHYDRYQGVAELMPFAKGVSAKSYDFDEQGNETKIDYRRMMKIVADHGYHGHVGIEYEGSRLSSPDGVRATKSLLERVRDELAKEHA